MNLAANLASPPSYCSIPEEHESNRTKSANLPSTESIPTASTNLLPTSGSHSKGEKALLEELETANVSNPYIHQVYFTRNRVIRLRGGGAEIFYDQRKVLSRTGLEPVLLGGPANYPFF